MLRVNFRYNYQFTGDVLHTLNDAGGRLNKSKFVKNTLNRANKQRFETRKALALTMPA